MIGQKMGMVVKHDRIRLKEKIAKLKEIQILFLKKIQN